MCEIVENCITYQCKSKNPWLVTLVLSFQGAKWAIEILLSCFSIVNNQGETNPLRMEDKNIAIIKIYTWRKENNNWGKSKWFHILHSARAKSVKLGLCSVLPKQIANFYAILFLWKLNLSLTLLYIRNEEQNTDRCSLMWEELSSIEKKVLAGERVNVLLWCKKFYFMGMLKQTICSSDKQCDYL